jgi:hypothetical protein
MGMGFSCITEINWFDQFSMKEFRLTNSSSAKEYGGCLRVCLQKLV